MSLQRFVLGLNKEIEERQRTIVESLVNGVPHDLAGMINDFYQRGYCKAIADVKTIMKELQDDVENKTQSENSSDS